MLKNQPQISCDKCSLNRLCLPLGLKAEEVSLLDKMINRTHHLKRGEFLFRSGEAFHSLYAVRAGSLKTLTPSVGGSEQIVGFHLSGELLGFDAINTEKHTCDASALETTSLCEIPFDQLQNLSINFPSLQRHIFRLMSREISTDEGLLLLLGKKSAEERLASFLLSLSNRFSRYGFSPYEFNLSMSRYDISNHLGLAVETVSRLFTRFQSNGLIQVSSKNVKIMDLNKLKNLSEGKGF